MENIFTETARDSGCAARTGRLALAHGEVETPVFMPVGTNATVKALTKEMLAQIGFDLILANTYHLYLRPGQEIVRKAGGLHGFTGWKRNFLTDSGGFQVFSLAPFRKVTERVVAFQSHIDGSRHFLSPEDVVGVQASLGSDVVMQLDVCTKHGTSYKDAILAVVRTTDWAKRSRTEWERRKGEGIGRLFGIVQGNFYRDLRKRSAEEILDLDLPGVAIGGLSVGEPFEVFAEFLASTAELLPASKPRYLMGIGTPRYILEAVENGIDMFDCVFPTRTARNGLLFARGGSIAIKKSVYEADFSPIDPSCGCKVCAEYSRAYLRHLFKSGEILYSTLASYHNLHFLKALVDDIRTSIREGRFLAFKREFLDSYSGAEGEKP
jgi:queuine tRNA-ribosyltransferase